MRTQKIVLRSEDQQGNPTLKVDKHDQEIIPIFRVDYRLTDNTDIRLGFQGLDVGDGSDLFYYKIRNLKDNFESQNRATYGLSLSNRTSFNGYNVVFDFGYKYTTIDFLRPADQSKGSAESTIFFTVFAGF